MVLRVKYVFVFLFALSLSNLSFAQGAKLLILGDSLSAGYGLKQADSWPQLLQNEWKDEGIEIVNGSISGETTSGGLARLPRLLEQNHPSHILIELGGNDGLRGYSIEQMTNNIEKMIVLAQQSNVNVLIQQMRIPSNFGKRYGQMFTNAFSQLALEYQVPLIPFFLEDVALEPSLMQSDGIHPNKDAQTMIAAFMQKQLKPYLNGE